MRDKVVGTWICWGFLDTKPTEKTGNKARPATKVPQSSSPGVRRPFWQFTKQIFSMPTVYMVSWWEQRHKQCPTMGPASSSNRGDRLEKFNSLVRKKVEKATAGTRKMLIKACHLSSTWDLVSVG